MGLLMLVCVAIVYYRAAEHDGKSGGLAVLACLGLWWLLGWAGLGTLLTCVALLVILFLVYPTLQVLGELLVKGK
ncbi:hypothetical protein KQI84_18345 [bacterium]|nr:hypothetical protein [bacterium]